MTEAANYRPCPVHWRAYRDLAYTAPLTQKFLSSRKEVQVGLWTKLRIKAEAAALSDKGIALSQAASKLKRSSVSGITSASKGIGDSVGFGAWLLARACRPCITKLENLKAAYKAELQQHDAGE